MPTIEMEKQKYIDEEDKKEHEKTEAGQRKESLGSRIKGAFYKSDKEVEREKQEPKQSIASKIKGAFVRTPEEQEAKEKRDSEAETKKQEKLDKEYDDEIKNLEKEERKEKLELLKAQRQNKLQKLRSKQPSVVSNIRNNLSGMGTTGVVNTGVPSDPFAAFNNALGVRKHDGRGRPTKPLDPMGRLNSMLGIGNTDIQAQKPQYITEKHKIPYRDQTGKLRYHTSTTKIPVEMNTNTQQTRRDPLDFGFRNTGGEYRNPLDMFNQNTPNKKWRDPLDFRW